MLKCNYGRVSLQVSLRSMTSLRVYVVYEYIDNESRALASFVDKREANRFMKKLVKMLPHSFTKDSDGGEVEGEEEVVWYSDTFPGYHYYVEELPVYQKAKAAMKLWLK